MKLYTLDEWGPLKATGEIAVFGQLPSIVLADGKVVSQSGVIIRYVAKLANLVPENVHLQLDADMLVELANDMNSINPIACFYAKDSEAFTHAKDKYFDAFPSWCAAANRLLAGKDFFGGESVMYGDFALLPVIDNTLLVDPTALDAKPELAAWYGRCMADPKIHAYMGSRAKAGMPGTYVASS